jgi:hypothetical protein
MSGHTPKSGPEDVDSSECAMVREARKRLRTCRELWPDNEPAWCEQCRDAQKRVGRSRPASDPVHDPIGPVETLWPIQNLVIFAQI